MQVKSLHFVVCSLSLFAVAPISFWFCVGPLFCDVVFGVQWEGMAGCFNLLGAVYVCVDPFLLLPWIGIQSVIVVFSAHTQILSLTNHSDFSNHLMPYVFKI